MIIKFFQIQELKTLDGQDVPVSAKSNIIACGRYVQLSNKQELFQVLDYDDPRPKNYGSLLVLQGEYPDTRMLWTDECSLSASHKFGGNIKGEVAKTVTINDIQPIDKGK